MSKFFNVTGACYPEQHYMVNLQSRLEAIARMVANGEYFIINRARQYGKTTTLKALERYLANDYEIASLDFQLLSHASFSTEAIFVKSFARELYTTIRMKAEVSAEIKNSLRELAFAVSPNSSLADLFFVLSDWCAVSSKPVVLMIDEVDSASNNQVFLDFLAQLRGYYLLRNSRPAFKAVILAGVHDIKNLRRKIRPEEDHKANSPWNIAADFNIDMSFSKQDIANMLTEYEADKHTDMDIASMSGLLYDYTSGYPFLVSKLCKLLDEDMSSIATHAWSREGFLEAVKLLLAERNTLFESLSSKLVNYPQLDEMLQALLFEGKSIVYNAFNENIASAAMFGFVKNSNGNLIIANRIYEMWLYNLYLSTAQMQKQSFFVAGQQDKNQC